ncbi:uncharacterized protein LOC135492473 isoform X2 [Lineus longissimus]|uniref:uncharacterized protein LOC135492473 isoform X2 n=1 Tax=Lineus longissimus TaxID=88925 RepID=UPI00315C8882
MLSRERGSRERGSRERGSANVTEQTKADIKRKELEFIKRKESLLSPKGRAKRAQKKLDPDFADANESKKVTPSTSSRNPSAVMKKDAEKKKVLGQANKNREILEKIRQKHSLKQSSDGPAVDRGNPVKPLSVSTSSGRSSSSQKTEKHSNKTPTTTSKSDSKSNNHQTKRHHVEVHENEKKNQHQEQLRSQPKRLKGSSGVTTYAESSETSDEEGRLVDLGADRLAFKVMALRREKARLQEHVKEYQEMNYVLQKELPELIKTNSKCKECQGKMRKQPRTQHQPAIVFEDMGIDISDDESSPAPSATTLEIEVAAEPAILTSKACHAPPMPASPAASDSELDAIPKGSIALPATATTALPATTANVASVAPQTKTASAPAPDTSVPDVDKLEDAFPLLNEATTIAAKKKQKFGKVVGILLRALFDDTEIGPETTQASLDERRLNLIRRHILKHFIGEGGNALKTSLINVKITQAIKYLKKQADQDTSSGK